MLTGVQRSPPEYVNQNLSMLNTVSRKEKHIIIKSCIEDYLSDLA